METTSKAKGNENIIGTLEEPTKTVSFREVHAELEAESIFLSSISPTSNKESFEQKGNFLNSIGFGQSIATRLYTSIANSKEVVERNQIRYPNFKFILEPQLERLCEKYNLYVREPKFFIGDIPTKNIDDMMKAEIYLSDLIPLDSKQKAIVDLYQMSYDSNYIFNKMCEDIRRDNLDIKFFYDAARIISKTIQERRGFTPDDISILQDWYHRKLKLSEISNYIEIAAIKRLFDEKAFAESDARIISRPNPKPMFFVDLDPIVMVKTAHGRLIITAWGDEANDELVVNQKMN